MILLIFIAEVTYSKYALMCKIVKKTRNVTIFIYHTVAIGSSMAVDVLFVNTFLLKIAILEEFSANIKIIISKSRFCFVPLHVPY